MSTKGERKLPFFVLLSQTLYSVFRAKALAHFVVFSFAELFGLNYYWVIEIYF